MALGAAFFCAIAAIVTKKHGDTPPHLIALIHVCVGTFMIAPFADLTSLPTDLRTWRDFIVMGGHLHRPGLRAAVRSDPKAADALGGRAVLPLPHLCHGG